MAARACPVQPHPGQDASGGLRKGRALHQHQYGFEEICAKTLYNMSGHVPGGEWPYPFDDDSPFWVVPLAVGFARALGVADPYSVSSLLRAEGGM